MKKENKANLFFNNILCVLILICFFLITNVQAQENLDGLRKTLPKVNSNSAFQEAKNAFLVIEKDRAAVTNFFNSEEEALQYFQEVLEWVKNNGSQADLLFAKRTVLYYYIHFADDVEIISRCRDLLSYSDQLDGKLKVGLLYNLKEAYRRTEQFKEYIEILPEYHEQSRLFGYTSAGEENYNCEVAFVHYSLKNYDKAVIAYSNCAQELEEKESYLAQSGAYNNVGLSYQKQQKLDSSNIYFEKAIKVIRDRLAVGTNPNQYYSHFENVIRGNIASNMVKNNRLDEALVFFYRELKSGKRFGELNIVTSAYFNIAEVYYLQNQHEKTVQYLDSTLAILKSYTSISTKKRALYMKAKSLLQLEEKELANEAFDHYDRYVDSLEVEKAKKGFMMEIVKYETNLKTEELSEIRQKIDQEQTVNFYQRIGIWFLVFLLIVFFLTFWKINKSNQIIKHQKKEVDHSLKEKELLIREIHHRVKNNLQVISSLLQIQSIKFKSEEFDSLMNQSQRQIKAMSLVHEMLYNKDQLSLIPMSEYLKGLSIGLVGTFENKNVEVELDVKHIDLSIDYANPIGLIVTELITNSMKHAFDEEGGIIYISLTERSGTYFLNYSDSGTFISANKNEKETFGNKLIRLLSEEMNAQLHVSKEDGISYTITFKTKDTHVK